MKKIRLKRLSIIAIIIAAVVTLYFLIGILTFSISSESYSHSQATESSSWNMPDSSENVSSFGGIFLYNQASDSMPHYKYQRIEDSIKGKKQELNNQNNSVEANFQGFQNIGIAAIAKQSSWTQLYKQIDSLPALKKLQDSSRAIMLGANTMHNDDSASLTLARANEISERRSALLTRLMDSARKEHAKDQLYFLGIGNFSLDNESRFFIQNGTYHLAYLSWDTVRTNGRVRVVGHYTSKPLQVRYAADNKRLLIPISKGLHDFLAVVNLVFLSLFMFVCVYIFVGLPVHLLVTISRGRAFTEKNISAFRVMSTALFIISICSIIYPYVFRWWYRNIIPADFSLPSPASAIWDNAWPLLIALILFVIGKAFKKGYRLQQENELTV
jgi:hypothetical protein